MLRPDATVVVYAQDAFARGHSKTAEGMLEYGSCRVVAVIDRGRSGRSVGQVLPWLRHHRDVPILASLEDSLALAPDALLLGVAPRGGALPAEWRRDISFALEHGMNIVNGLHFMVGHDPEFAEVARRHGRWIWDTREPPAGLPVGSGLAAEVSCEVVLTVGTDCVVGKMVTALEITAEACRRGIRARFIPTGQTGIMIAGFGISIDRVIGDFMAGATERLILDNAAGCELLLVEGQGSLLHPGYSGVTMGLIHGCMPGKMILCHEINKRTIRDSTIAVPTLDEVRRLYEAVTLPTRKGVVVGISLNSAAAGEDEARRELERLETSLGLPATDPLRFGAAPLLDAILVEDPA
ncbi:DUF1611 domain-containing protein [bacterium]|nr:DUF1611 domain-containing protein [candidate division CSSED10-310 bacterium]